MIVVIDASVALKWILPDSETEEDGDGALALLAAIQRGEASVLQPAHWLTEVVAVLSRLRPEIVDECIELFDLMELPVAGEAVLVKRASRLARELDHHLFDTLYHAVALEHEGTLVTADRQYARKARKLGRLVELRHWPLAGTGGDA